MAKEVAQQHWVYCAPLSLSTENASEVILGPIQIVAVTIKSSRVRPVLKITWSVLNRYEKGLAIAGLCALAVAVLAAVPACAQMAEVKEKPPMYSYIANWAIPRAQWAEMDKQAAANQKMMEKGIADGNIIGYGTI
jgi:hypothetical protein